MYTIRIFAILSEKFPKLVMSSPQESNEKIYIYFRDEFVGAIANVSWDMWYGEGDWQPENTQFAKQFMEYIEATDSKQAAEAFRNLRGKLVKWSCESAESIENPRLMDGLAMFIYGGRITIRMVVSPEGTEILRRNKDYL